MGDDDDLIGGSRYLPLHKWAAINQTELESWLVWCVDHPGERRHIGEKARAAMFKSYRRDIIAQDIKLRIDAIKTQIGLQGIEGVRRRNKQLISLRDAEETQKIADLTLNSIIELKNIQE